MRRVIFAFVFVSLPLSGVLAQQATGAGAHAAPPGIEVDALDRAADACTGLDRVKRREPPNPQHRMRLAATNRLVI
jgi:hypothetical protein